MIRNSSILLVSLIMIGCTTDPVVEPSFEPLHISSSATFVADQTGLISGWQQRDTVEVFFTDSTAFDLAIEDVFGDSTQIHFGFLTSGKAAIHRLEFIADTTLKPPHNGSSSFVLTVRLRGKKEGATDALGHASASYVLFNR